MGLRGPRPLPSKVLEGHGSWRANIVRDEPVPPKGRPPCPEWLDEDATQVWNQTVEHLEIMQLLTIVDGNALARYCQTFARWKRAEEFIQKYGETYPLKDEKGQVRCFMPWPQVAISHKLATLLTRLEQEFGLTPSARSRVSVGATRTLARPGLSEEDREFFKLRIRRPGRTGTAAESHDT